MTGSITRRLESENESESERSEDEQPQSKRYRRSRYGQIDEGFLNITADDVSKRPRADFIAGQRRRRRFTPARRSEVAAVRRVGACAECRKRRVRCKHALNRIIPSSNNKNKDHQYLETNNEDGSNPSSLSSASSVATHFGTAQLDKLNEHAPPGLPIDRFLVNFDDDPPAGWLADASYTSDSNRDPTFESRARLSPKLENLSNKIDAKDDLHLRTDESTFSNNFSQTFQSYFQQNKDQKLQSYLPRAGHNDHVAVHYARKPVAGEQPTWHAPSGRVTTQPPRLPRTENGGVKKNRGKNSVTNNRATPSVLRPQPEQQQQQRPRLSPRQIAPTHHLMEAASPGGLAPSWTPRRQHVPQGMNRSQSNQGQLLDYRSAQFSPAQSVHFSPHHGYGEQSTLIRTPSHPSYSGTPSMLPSTYVHGASMSPTPQLTYDIQQSTSDGISAYSNSGATPHAQSISAQSPQATPFRQSIGFSRQQMHAEQQFSPAQGPRVEDYLDPSSPAERFRSQQAARALDYGTGRMNNMVNDMNSPIIVNSVFDPPWPELQSLRGDYTFTTVPNQNSLAPSNHSNNMTRQPTYNNTSTVSNPVGNNQFYANLAVRPASNPAYSTSRSQPPTLTMGALSEITPMTPFDSSSNYGELLGPYPTHQQEEGFFASFRGVPRNELSDYLFRGTSQPAIAPPTSYAGTGTGTADSVGRGDGFSKVDLQSTMTSSGYASAHGINTGIGEGLLKPSGVLEFPEELWSRDLLDFSDSSLEG